MFNSVLTLALLSASALAAPQPQPAKRQATDGPQFTSAGNDFLSAYIPSAVYSELVSIVSTAAAAASVTGDAASLLNSAFLDVGLPDWLESAIPEKYSSQIAAADDNIDEFRGTVDLVPFVVAVTTTDSEGATVTSDVTTHVPSTATGVVSYITTEVIDGVTSVYSTAFDGASSIASEVIGGGSTVVGAISSGGSSVASEISSGGSSVFSEATSGASSVFSEATSGASSVFSEATSGASSIVSEASTFFNGEPTSSSTGGAAHVTAAAGGVLGLVGLMMAL